MSKLKDKVIVVTGSNGLIGKAIVARLKEGGARCIQVDIAVTGDEELDNFKVDITVPENIDELLGKIIAKYGRIDGLVNNAYPRTADWGKKFENILLSSWRENVDIQLNATFYLTQQVLALMKEKQSGSIVNIGSIYGVVGPDFNIYENTEMTSPAAYAAIKGAVINFTRYLASYFGPHNIRVNCVSPGGIFDNQNESFVAKYKRNVPLARMGYPEDIAGPVAFLLSDEASYITGVNLLVDGGLTAK